MTHKIAIGVLAICAAASIGFVSVHPHARAGDNPAPVTKEGSAAFRQVVKTTLPAVVSITPKSKAVQVARRPRDGRSDDNRDPQSILREFMEQMEEMPQPQPSGGMGSGVIVGPEGTVVTNNHVVGNAAAVEVKLQDGRSFVSKEIIKDPKTDLAVIKLETKPGYNLPYAEFGDSGRVDIGDWVLAMGSPFGLSGTVTAGIVSSKGRPLGAAMYEDFLQTDAAINPGNSGGPLVDLDGKVIGINTAIRSGTGTFAGVAFAIPSNMAKDVVEQILKHGKVRRGYLGIEMGDLAPAVREKLGVPSGVMVQSIAGEDTPAQKAGLKPNDIIVDVDGTPINDIRTLKNMIGKIPPGQVIKMRVNRDANNLIVPVTIEEQPAEYGLTRGNGLRQFRNRLKSSVEIKALGMTVASNPNGRGVVVSDVADDGPAASAGIQVGAVIADVERRPVASPEQFAEIVGKVNLKEGILMRVRFSDDTTKLIVIKIGDEP